MELILDIWYKKDSIVHHHVGWHICSPVIFHHHFLMTYSRNPCYGNRYCCWIENIWTITQYESAGIYAKLISTKLHYLLLAFRSYHQRWKVVCVPMRKNACHYKLQVLSSTDRYFFNEEDVNNYKWQKSNQDKRLLPVKKWPEMFYGRTGLLFLFSLLLSVSIHNTSIVCMVLLQ